MKICDCEKEKSVELNYYILLFGTWLLLNIGGPGNTLTVLCWPDNGATHLKCHQELWEDRGTEAVGFLQQERATFANKASLH